MDSVLYTLIMRSGQGQKRDAAQVQRAAMLRTAAGLAAVGIGVIILGPRPWAGLAALATAVVMGIVLARR
jgi:hypothetical protein